MINSTWKFQRHHLRLIYPTSFIRFRCYLRLDTFRFLWQLELHINPLLSIQSTYLATSTHIQIFTFCYVEYLTCLPPCFDTLVLQLLSHQESFSLWVSLLRLEILEFSGQRQGVSQYSKPWCSPGTFLCKQHYDIANLSFLVWWS